MHSGLFITKGQFQLITTWGYHALSSNRVHIPLKIGFVVYCFVVAFSVSAIAGTGKTASFSTVSTTSTVSDAVIVPADVTELTDGTEPTDRTDSTDGADSTDGTDSTGGADRTDAVSPSDDATVTTDAIVPVDASSQTDPAGPVGGTVMDDTVSAASSGEVVLVSLKDCCASAAWIAAEQAIAAELSLLDIQVLFISNPRDSVVTGIDLIDIAKAHEAKVVLVVSKTSPTVAKVELVVVHNVTAVTMRDIVVKDTSVAGSASIVAFRTVDTLRAAQDEFKSAQQSQNVKPTAVSKEGSSSNKPVLSHELSVSLGAVALTSFGAAGVRGGFDLSFSWRVGHLLGLTAEGAFASLGKQISSGSTTSELSLGVLRGWLSLYPYSGKWVVFSISAGGGAILVVGEGVKGEVSLHKDRTGVGYIGTGIDMRLLLTRTIFIPFGAKLGMALPEISLVHGDETVAELGRPLVEIFLGVGFKLP